MERPVEARPPRSQPFLPLPPIERLLRLEVLEVRKKLVEKVTLDIVLEPLPD